VSGQCEVAPGKLQSERLSTASTHPKPVPVTVKGDSSQDPPELDGLDEEFDEGMAVCALQRFTFAKVANRIQKVENFMT